MIPYSIKRFTAIVAKEFTQMRRDRLTFAMMVGIPLLQLILFGFAINSNPKNLPTAIINMDPSPLSRTFITALQNTDYFQITHPNTNETQANKLMATSDIRFIANIPTNFTRDFIRGDAPKILITADATDPMVTANSIAALNFLAQNVFNEEIQRGLPHLSSHSKPFQLNIHPRYNPEIINQYNTVPGLMGVILTMTMVMITALAITREYERGTMETLLSLPIRPLEVMLGKITSYIIVGYIQQTLVIILAVTLFNVPMQGNILLLFIATLPFILANLSVGITFSTIARNQLQAVQMAFFFFLPSILLSGFMFPFQGMPHWAQAIGQILPLKHFLLVVRGIMLKGNSLAETLPNITPILIFMLITLTIATKRYRQTLD